MQSIQKKPFYPIVILVFGSHVIDRYTKQLKAVEKTWARWCNAKNIKVLETAGSKWNFLPFKPGLVGVHCSGVDPYYLTHKAEKLGYHPQVILAGRRINDGMGKYIAEKAMLANKVQIRGAKVGILGFTFKENCPDVRNTKVIDIINELKEYSIESIVIDPVANAEEANQGYNINVLKDYRRLDEVNTVIVAVAHALFRSNEVLIFLEQLWLWLMLKIPLILEIRYCCSGQYFSGFFLDVASQFRKSFCKK